MLHYFYITMVSFVVIFIMIREIYHFNNGRYYPYLTWNKEDSTKKRIFDYGLLIVLLVSLSADNKPPLFLVCLMIALPICINILNFLSYAKIKDRKIIKQTVILDMSIIAYFLIMEFIFRCLIPNT